MSIKKGDNRSVRHTKSRIREGFLSLLKEKPIKEISVKELTDKIDLNRGTFYFHYKDIYDLQNQLEEAILSELSEMFNPANNPQDDIYKNLCQLFNFLKDNADFCSIMFGPNGDAMFIKKTKDIVNQALMVILKNRTPGKDASQYDFFDAFLINGFLGMVQVWYNNDMLQTPEDMAVFATSIITSSFESFARL